MAKQHVNKITLFIWTMCVTGGASCSCGSGYYGQTCSACDANNESTCHLWYTSEWNNGGWVCDCDSVTNYWGEDTDTCGAWSYGSWSTCNREQAQQTRTVTCPRTVIHDVRHSYPYARCPGEVTNIAQRDMDDFTETQSCVCAVDGCYECKSNNENICVTCQDNWILSADRSTCTEVTCANGLYQPEKGEECDDGNTDDGDGCAADCTREENFDCTLNVDTLTVCTATSASLELTAGDIAIIGFNMYGADEITLVALRDIYTNTVIRFTDKGWTQSTENFRAVAGREGLHIWTSTQFHRKGSLITITDMTTLMYSHPAWSWTQPDQMYAYQSRDLTYHHLDALNIVQGNWHTANPGSVTQGNLPQTGSRTEGLEDGVTALTFMNSKGCGGYITCPDTGSLIMTKSEMLRYVHNESNWETSALDGTVDLSVLDSCVISIESESTSNLVEQNDERGVSSSDYQQATSTSGFVSGGKQPQAAKIIIIGCISAVIAAFTVVAVALVYRRGQYHKQADAIPMNETPPSSTEGDETELDATVAI